MPAPRRWLSHARAATSSTDTFRTAVYAATRREALACCLGNRDAGLPVQLPVLPDSPPVNQRTWRHKSPQRFAAELKHICENFGIRAFFGTDDNFFNNRGSVESLMGELGRTTTGGLPFGERIKFYTEGTQADVFKEPRPAADVPQSRFACHLVRD